MEAAYALYESLFPTEQPAEMSMGILYGREYH